MPRAAYLQPVGEDDVGVHGRHVQMVDKWALDPVGHLLQRHQLGLDLLTQLDRESLNVTLFVLRILNSMQFKSIKRTNTFRQQITFTIYNLNVKHFITFCCSEEMSVKNNYEIDK